MYEKKRIKLNKFYLFAEAKYTVFVLFFYFFLLREYLESQIGFLSYIDELVAVFAFLLFFINGLTTHSFKIEKYSICIILFLICGLLGNLFYGYQSVYLAVLTDAFINAKFWLAIYFGICIFSGFDFERYAKSLYFHIRLVIFVFVALTIADNVFGIFSLIPEYGFRSTHLFYSHPTHFTWACVMLCVILMCIRKHVKHADLLFGICIILMLSTLKIKALVTVLAFLFVYYYNIRKHKKISLTVVAVFCLFAFAIGYNKIYFYFFSEIQSTSARYQLFVTAFKICGDHFPFGAGFGTFASNVSGVYYSVIYNIYGISGVNGIMPNDTSFINDTFWPMVLGQTGIFGLILFVAALVFLYSKIKQLKKTDIEIFGVALMIFAAMLISSVMESAFVHPNSIPIAVILGMLLTKNKAQNFCAPSNNITL